MSYRRADTAGFAGRLFDVLGARFGPDRVFRDIESIAAGSDFLETIQSTLAACRAVVVVIGPEWATMANGGGRPRLQDPTDVLRLEIEAALAGDVLVVPVLVEDAEMPPESALPETLRPLLRRNALEVSDSRWDHDVSRLLAVLRAVVRPRRPFRLHARQVLAGGAGALTLLGTALGIYWGLVPFFSRDASLGPMTGDFNIAVAAFREVAPDGRVTASADGDALSSTLFDRLDAELKPFADAGFVIQRRSAKDTPTIGGATPEARAKQASRVAARIQADLVIFGALRTGPDVGLVPEFFLSERRFANAAEIVGQHELGGEVAVGGTLDNPVVAKLLRDRLVARVQAMTEFVIGLGYYAVDGNYATALGHFEAAAATPGWDDSDGKEVLHLFVGNAAQKMGDLDRTEAAYRRSVEIEPEYGRGRLGVAEAQFQRSQGTCEAGYVDAQGLERAVSGFRSAVQARVQSASSDVAVKADLGSARVQTCQSQALVADRWQDAATAFRRVIAAYEAGNPRIRQLAAEAYGGLGLVELPSAGATTAEAADRYRRSADSYQRAIDLSVEAARTASFLTQQAFAFDRLGDPQRSAAARAEAARLRGSHGS